VLREGISAQSHSQRPVLGHETRGSLLGAVSSLESLLERSIAIIPVALKHADTLP
jgi:hypothetical protein